MAPHRESRVEPAPRIQPKRRGIRPGRTRSWHRWVIMLGVLFLLGIPGRGHSQHDVSVAPPTSSGASFIFSELQLLNEPLLSTSHKGKERFIPNLLPTTRFGPAWADIVLRPRSNFLECQGAAIALCYYSGPGPADPSQPDLSCELTSDGRFAKCNCLEIPQGPRYFVDINAILSLEVYLDTVKECGHDGSGCLPKGKKTAPVCDAINKGKLIPGADVISTFSLALEPFPSMRITQTTCPNGNRAPLYAGCMTAPCTRTGNFVDIGPLRLQVDECSCPTFDGPYQVGQEVDSSTTAQCDLATVPPPVGGSNLVWSAAYAPLAGGTIFPTTPTCFPDAPGPSGCPLLPRGNIPRPPENVSCRRVCDEYRKSENQAGVEVGFTCDATLCTAALVDLDLVSTACEGLGNGPISEIIRLETEVGYSCAASQICTCRPNPLTNQAIDVLNKLQNAEGIATQCDQNGTLCGAQP